MKIRVERIAPEGEGIGKAQGSDKIVFVPYGLPGDLVEADLVQEKTQYSRARIKQILKASQSRVEPRCPIHFSPEKTFWCGGCDWQHSSYDAQLRFKSEIVADCLRRIAKLNVPISAVLPSPQTWRYRNKVQIPFQVQQGAKQGFVAGFYVPGTHRIVELDDCLVQPTLAVAVVRTVKELVKRFGWPTYDEHAGRGWLRHLYLRSNASGEIAVVFVTRERRFPDERQAVAELLERHPQVVSVRQNVQQEKTSVVLGPIWRKLAGKDRLIEKIGRLTIEFTPGAFFQVNTPAAETLYSVAERLLFNGSFRPRLVLDLYCGVGAIALWLSSRVERVIGIEESSQAVEDAYFNARRLGADNVSFVKGVAERAILRLRGLGAAKPWAAVLDPPRTGCGKGVLEFLVRREFTRVVYVSCNPATFARDARLLVDSGYALSTVQPVDLFPQTSHVELVGLFDRKS